MPPFDRVEVVNPSDGNFLHWLLKFYAFGALCGVGLLGLTGLGVYGYFNSRLPVLPDIDRYQHEAAESTVLRGWDGTVLADWAKERREVLTASQVPPRLIQAFLAIEDRRFYEHAGLDFRGIMRAALANLRAGEVEQGGSTITQQVAKTFFARDLFFSRSLFRKIPRGHPRPPHRVPLLEAGHPHPLPQPDLPGTDRLRGGGRRAPLLQQEHRDARPG